MKAINTGTAIALIALGILTAFTFDPLIGAFVALTSTLKP